MTEDKKLDPSQVSALVQQCRKMLDETAELMEPLRDCTEKPKTSEGQKVEGFLPFLMLPPYTRSEILKLFKELGIEKSADYTYAMMVEKCAALNSGTFLTDQYQRLVAVHERMKEEFGKTRSDLEDSLDLVRSRLEIAEETISELETKLGELEASGPDALQQTEGLAGGEQDG